MFPRICILLIVSSALPFIARPAAAQSALITDGLRKAFPHGGEAKPFCHLPENEIGWSITQTHNFHILHRGNRPLAERFARAAEQARSAAFLRWFGEAGTGWRPRCDIYLYTSDLSFHRATGVPKSVPGVSTTQGERGRVFSRRIDLRCNDPHVLNAILPHEITHIVFADYFGSSLSAWANEGIAVQVEPRNRIWLHLRNLPVYREQGRLLPIASLIRLAGYPSPQKMGPFYAQSASLVAFLIQEHGPRTLVQFLQDSQAQGYEDSLQRHYGVTLQELDRRWLRYAFEEESVASRR